MILVKKRDDGWSRVRKDDAEGWAPTSCVRPLACVDAVLASLHCVYLLHHLAFIFTFCPLWSSVLSPVFSFSCGAALVVNVLLIIPCCIVRISGTIMFATIVSLCEELCLKMHNTPFSSLLLFIGNRNARHAQDISGRLT